MSAAESASEVVSQDSGTELPPVDQSSCARDVLRLRCTRIQEVRALRRGDAKFGTEKCCTNIYYDDTLQGDKKKRTITLTLMSDELLVFGDQKARKYVHAWATSAPPLKKRKIASGAAAFPAATVSNGNTSWPQKWEAYTHDEKEGFVKDIQQQTTYAMSVTHEWFQKQQAQIFFCQRLNAFVLELLPFKLKDRVVCNNNGILVSRENTTLGETCLSLSLVFSNTCRSTKAM